MATIRAARSAVQELLGRKRDRAGRRAQDDCMKLPVAAQSDHAGRIFGARSQVESRISLDDAYDQVAQDARYRH
jgi:hypothetical protein